MNAKLLKSCLAGTVFGMASAAAWAQPAVLLTGAAATSPTDCRWVDTQAKLMSTGLLGAVDILPATASTPTLGQLLQYDVVMVWSNNQFASAAAMGDVLADYVDAGGAVVVAVFATASIPLDGRWVSGGYEVIIGGSGQTQGTQQFLGTIHQPGHPIMADVNSFSGGTQSFRPTVTDLAPGALRIADWDDGRVLVAVGANPQRVDLGMYPPSSDCASTFWTSSTDGARLMANALVFAAIGGSQDPGGCCFNDGTCQVLTGLDCFNQGGSFRGGNTDCNDPCPQPGACCFPNGACDVTLESACLVGGGTWSGAGTDCSPNPCPQPPTGACCLGDGSCIIEWEGGCLAQGGLYQGDNTDCANITCPSRIDAHWDGASNAGTTDAGAYFLVEVTEPQGIEIAGFDINTNAAAGTPITAHVYFRPVTFVGFTGDFSAWILMGEVPTTAAGPGNPTPVPVGGLNIAGGETWALRVGSSTGVRYNSNATTNPTFNDGRVILHMGEVQNNFFGTSTFGSYPADLRGWNGSMYYHIGATVTTGSCCMPDGSCEEIQEIICTGQGGTYHGDNTTCATTPPGGCPQPPTGACCLSDGNCITEWETGCLNAGGVYQGDGTECANITCPIMPIFPEDHVASNAFPFSMTPGTTMHQVFNSDLFMSINQGEPIQIEHLAFSPTTTATFNGTLALRLGYTNAIPGVGSASGGLAIPDLGGGGGPNAVGPMHEFYNQPVVFTPSNNDPENFEFTFEGDPFEYDPMQGNLLLEIYITNLASGFSSSRGAGDHNSSRAYHRHSGATSELTGQAGRTMFTISIDSDRCYANCDGSTQEPVLTVDDFTCFINEFAAASALPHEQQVTHYANCDGSTTMPALTVDDFTCFINEFAQGCP